ncbi:hypothetical protein [Limosilactobacillus mucosae]|uniref:hypothetical protein n=1 Tax=Limosilactobacillus mucosae TaxID=97478 RepID=UPI0025A33A1B|nr:hypothetical protein [Limosilactobacillus mucosae]MDM8220844.1 hypothetical protein [Limosilactobacillus mucosae]
MMFAKGKYVNADGLSSRAYYLRVPPDKLRDFQTAILKASHHDYLALATDQGCRLRAVLLEGRLIRQLPKNARAVGDCFAVLYGADNRPLMAVDLVQTIPKSVMERTLSDLAVKIYLPEARHQLPK